MELNSKYGIVKIYTDTVGDKAIGQIIQMANSPLGAGANIRIMPDCHEGAGCVIGTTMLISGKVCPNLVGVDIGCGVTLVKTDIDFSTRLKELDGVIRRCIPHGTGVHSNRVDYDFSALKCWRRLNSHAQDLAKVSLGTLGGGNHFVEAYDGGYLAVHSGSRNLGVSVAKHYQKVAEEYVKYKNSIVQNNRLDSIRVEERVQWDSYVEVNNLNLSYLENDDMRDYLHDMQIVQKFADDNRKRIIDKITTTMGGKVQSTINTIHNYIDIDSMILRKGAISAREGEVVVIPLNMRDGMLICRGKGNADWNYSAPHGAGRLYSRSKAKSVFSVEQYRESMQGIYTTCIGEGTLDEAPFVYKDYEEIMTNVEPTVEILERITPIYNFKA